MNNTVDVEQAAELMKVHPKTVKDLINSGALPAGKIGRAYVLMTKDVLNYIENMIVRQTAERMGSPVKRLRNRSPELFSKIRAPKC